MAWTKYLALSKKKILWIIILLVLLSVPGFIPAVTDPMSCVSRSCNINIGLPLHYLTIEWGAGIINSQDFNIFSLLIDAMIFYMVISILFYLFRRRENVPNSNS